MICDEDLTLFDLTNNRTVFFLETLINISNAYGAVHKYICLFICIFGSLANAVHIYVLTQPIMQKCAVNRLLSIIAVCDIFTMLSYLAFILRFGFAVDQSSPPTGYELQWIIFLLAHVVGSIAFHTIELYLTVVTALIRYKTLKRVGSFWNRKDAAFPIFIVVAAFVAILCIPTFLVHSIVSIEVSDGAVNKTLYTVGLAEFDIINTCFLFKLNLWLTGILFKVIPCILLLFFTLALLYELELNSRRRKQIFSGSTLASRRNPGYHSDRTTKILLILLFVFLCTEFPQGCLAILNGLWPNDIHQFVYMSLGEVLDLLSLINCNTCFIVYPLISSQYRKVLRVLAFKIRHREFWGGKSVINLTDFRIEWMTGTSIRKVSGLPDVRASFMGTNAGRSTATPSPNLGLTPSQMTLSPSPRLTSPFWMHSSPAPSPASPVSLGRLSPSGFIKQQHFVIAENSTNTTVSFLKDHDVFL